MSTNRSGGDGSNYIGVMLAFKVEISTFQSDDTDPFPSLEGVRQTRGRPGFEASSRSRSSIDSSNLKMLNSHGSITQENYEQCVAETKLYGPKRVKVAKEVLNALQSRKSEFQLFLDAGTLLGAYRNGNAARRRHFFV